ncbi:unnamed protein product [Musa textilis]
MPGQSPEAMHIGSRNKNHCSHQSGLRMSKAKQLLLLLPVSQTLILPVQRKTTDGCRFRPAPSLLPIIIAERPPAARISDGCRLHCSRPDQSSLYSFPQNAWPSVPRTDA